MGLFEAIVLALVEGITEFLPISSTGHMIVVSSLLEIQKEEFTKLYEVFIQFGAILSVVYLYWKRFTKVDNTEFFIKLGIGMIPALILGFLLGDYVDKLLESPRTVAISLIVGGVFFLFIDTLFRDSVNSVRRISRISRKNAFVIGFWQCLALVPGISRSAASIIGGLQQGLTRQMAAEFSFFLAVPTMLAAATYKTIKVMIKSPDIMRENLTVLAIGNVVAFIVAVISIRFMMQFVEKYGFKYFGWYRIVAGLFIFYLLSKGLIVE
jgi:undecaprenyl-diphosphatase